MTKWFKSTYPNLLVLMQFWGDWLNWILLGESVLQITKQLE